MPNVLRGRPLKTGPPPTRITTPLPHGTGDSARQHTGDSTPSDANEVMA